MSPAIISPALITRERLYQRGSRFAWSWCYSVNGTTIGTNLASARRWAKDRGFTPICDWEAELVERKP